MTLGTRLTVAEIGLFERSVRLRMPFRFGSVTLTECTQAFATMRIRLEDGREGWGSAAELLAPKWFDKTPGLSGSDNADQLRAALWIAANRYTASGPTTAFGLYASGYVDQLDEGASCGLNPLVASYGPALLDRAVLDALCRASGVTLAEAIARNLPGVAVTDLTPDLRGFDMERFLATLRPRETIEVRHTVGLADPLREGGAVRDGLPESLAEVIATYGHRAFKLKLGGDVAADLARLRGIASVLDRLHRPYRVTLDGNEQYANVGQVETLIREIASRTGLRRLHDSLLFVEQPLPRQATLQTPVHQVRTPLLIDEADGTLDAFPKARAMGYRGVSSKSCKGLYKSLLNAARCRHWNAQRAESTYFMSAEDLTTPAGLAVQQDLAVAALLGLGHIERNGHHYINGMSGASETEQQAFLDAHGDLYHRAGRAVRLTIRDGRVALHSVNSGVGFATRAAPDFRSMRPMLRPQRTATRPILRP